MMSFCIHGHNLPDCTANNFLIVFNKTVQENKATVMVSCIHGVIFCSQ